VRWASVPTPAHRLALLRLAEGAALARPEAPRLQRLWAEALEAVGERERALGVFASACERFPDAETLHSGHAEALLRAGRIDSALAHLRPWPSSLWAQKLRLKLLMRAGREAEAEELEAALARADPADPDLLTFRAAKLRDSPNALLDLCDEALEHCPQAVHVLYHKALALTALGRSKEAAALMGLDSFLRIVRLDPPRPFDDRNGFAAELRSEIEANPTLHSDPIGHATRKGRRTATFPLPGDRAGTALIDAIKAQVADYCAGLAGDHPFVAARPRRANLKSWALIFDARGHQVLHHHPGPWLTGVYYAAAPEGRDRPGALRIGSVPAWLGAPPPWKVVDVAPEPGTLVLFPSFVPHETLPTGREETRISVAFDVTAADR
jgi:hypothetical protein